MRVCVPERLCDMRLCDMRLCVCVCVKHESVPSQHMYTTTDPLSSHSSVSPISTHQITHSTISHVTLAPHAYHTHNFTPSHVTVSHVTHLMRHSSHISSFSMSHSHRILSAALSSVSQTLSCHTLMSHVLCSTLSFHTISHVKILRITRCHTQHVIHTLISHPFPRHKLSHLILLCHTHTISCIPLYFSCHAHYVVTH